MSTLDTLTFEPMLITEVFDSVRSSTAWYDKSKLSREGENQYLFISRTRTSNGVDGTCSRQGKDPEPGNAITVALDTQVVAYQPGTFYTSQNIQVLRARQLNPDAGLVLVTLLSRQMTKFSWGGNGATLGRLSRTKMMVPCRTNSDGKHVVDWDGMTKLGRELMATAKAAAKRTRIARGSDTCNPAELTFAPMPISSLFDSIKTSSAWYDKVHLAAGPGENLYLSQTLSGNSVAAIVADQESDPEPGNCITVTLKTQATFYQPAPFYTAQNFLILRHANLNEDNALVLVTAIRRALTKFSWGYGVSIGRLSKTQLMVPVTLDNAGNSTVDWHGMEELGRALCIQVEDRAAAALRAA